MKPTLEQERAAYAWTVVSSMDSSLRDKYGKLAKGMPAMVMSSGLMQVLAFLKDKGEPQHRALLADVCTWIGIRFAGAPTTNPSVAFPPRNAAKFESVMAALFESDPLQFRHVTAEAMALLRWVRQMAAAR